MNNLNRSILTIFIVALTIAIISVAIPLYQTVQASRYENIGWEYLHKFGENIDVDAAEDVWDGGGDYPWPSVASVTTVVSTDVNDAAGDTGAITVKAIGLDSNYLEITEVVTLTGTTPVTLSNLYLRLHRASILTAGSTGTNEGDVQFKHGATTIAQITTDNGQTLMAVYTIPADYKSAELCRTYVSVAKFTGSSTTVAVAKLLFRAEGGAWQTKEVATASAQKGQWWNYDYGDCINIAPKTDIRWRVVTITATNSDVIATFDIRQKVRN